MALLQLVSQCKRNLSPQIILASSKGTLYDILSHSFATHFCMKCVDNGVLCMHNSCSPKEL